MRASVPVRGILLDFGGVLARFDGDAMAGPVADGELVDAQSMIATLFDNPPSYAALVDNTPVAEVLRRVADHVRIEYGACRRIWDRFWACQCFNAELARYVDELRPGVRVGVLSNMWICGRELFEDRFRLHHYVDFMMISAEQRRKKPDRELFGAALWELGCSPHETIFVDDSRVHVSSAIALGMRGLPVTATAAGWATLLAELRHAVEGGDGT